MLIFVQILSLRFPFAARTIGDLKFGIRDVYQVNKSESAHVAFKKMRERGSSALAIVDDDGSLVDVLSVSDLRLLGYYLFFVNLILLRRRYDPTSPRYPNR